MPTLVDYAVLSDGAFEIDSTPANSIPDQKILEFDVPSDFLQGVGTARPVLTYVVKYVNDDGSFGVWVDAKFPLKQSTRDHTLSWGNSDNHEKGMWECVQGTKFEPGERIKIVFGCIKGRARIRDVVLWFQRDV